MADVEMRSILGLPDPSEPLDSERSAMTTGTSWSTPRTARSHTSTIRASRSVSRRKHYELVFRNPLGYAMSDERAAGRSPRRDPRSRLIEVRCARAVERRFGGGPGVLDAVLAREKLAIADQAGVQKTFPVAASRDRGRPRLRNSIGCHGTWPCRADDRIRRPDSRSMRETACLGRRGRRLPGAATRTDRTPVWRFA
jgi:hypothetical protein